MSDKAKGKGKGNEEKKEFKPPPVLSKRRTLDLITSLNDDDDERTQLSKKISWILRHGYQRVGVSRDSEGFCKVADIRKVEIMEDVAEEKLMANIADSNVQKPRYELKDSPGGKLIRAIKKDERKAMRSGGGVAPTSPTAGKPISLAAATPMRSEAPAFVPGKAAAAAPAAAYNAYSPMANPWAAQGFFPMQYQMMQQMAAASGGAAAAKASGPGGNSRYYGKIKSYNDEKGFGFIESPQAQAHFGRDVFVHKAVMGGFTVGMDVNFTVETNKQGMPQARDLKITGGAAGKAAAKGAAAAKKAAAEGKGGKGEKKEKSSPKGKGKGKKKEGKGDDEKKSPVAPGEQPAKAEEQPAKSEEPPAKSD